MKKKKKWDQGRWHHSLILYSERKIANTVFNLRGGKQCKLKQEEVWEMNFIIKLFVLIFGLAAFGCCMFSVGKECSEMS